MTSRRRSSELAPPPTLKLIVGLAATIVCFAAAVSFGSTDLYLVGIWIALLSPLALIAIFGTPRPAIYIFFVASIVIAAFTDVAYLQTHTPPIVGEPADIWRTARTLLGDNEIANSVSIVSTQPFIALGPPLALVFTLFIGVYLGTDRSASRWMLKLLARCGAAYAAIAIMMYLYDPTHIFWKQKPGYLDDLTGTFLGRNTAASFIGMFMILNVAEAADRFKSLSSKLGWTLSAFGEKELMWPTAAAIICCLAVLLTSSRAGTILSIVLSALTVGLILRRALRISSLASAASLLLGFGAIVLLLLQIGGSSGRLSGQGLEDESRYSTYVSAVELISAHPLLGTGLGTFVWAYPPVRDPESINGVWDRAHNTILEIAVEGGFPLAALTVGAWLLVAIGLAQAAYKTGDPTVIGPFSIFMLLQIHSLVDFPLQIPGSAMFFGLICGLGLGQIAGKS